jgi:hypothetical protein
VRIDGDGVELTPCEEWKSGVFPDLGCSDITYRLVPEAPSSCFLGGHRFRSLLLG